MNELRKAEDYPLLISFYTDDWRYPEHAARLKDECQALGLDYRIEQRHTTGSYLKNTCLKPQFILDCFAKRPLLWVDVDASIYRKPDFFLEKGFDFQAKKIEDPSRRRSWHVGTMYFEPSEKLQAFFEDWIKNLKVTDESAFEQTWRQWADKLIVRDIPQTYFEIEPKKPSSECVIYHRLSKSPSKIKEINIARRDEERNG
jgi:hypothetical protein